MRNTAYTLESVDNALCLLTMLQKEDRIRLSAVAAELGVARSTAHRLLSTLVSRGYAVQDEDRCYTLGPAFRLPTAPTRVSAARVREVAHRHLAWLNRQVGETVHLMRLEGTEVRFLDCVQGREPVHIGSRIGATMHAIQTSGGKALLAAMDDSEITRLYSHAEGNPDLPGFLRLAREVRRRGYGTNVGESERGVSAIGMCIRDASGRPIAAVTISAPVMRMPGKKLPMLAPVLESGVHRIEHELQSATRRRPQEPSIRPNLVQA